MMWHEKNLNYLVEEHPVKKLSTWILASLSVVSLGISAFLFVQSQALSKPGDQAPQKVVLTQADGKSFLMEGDPLTESNPALKGGALPYLLEQGWKISSVHMTYSAGTQKEQHAAYFILVRQLLH